MKKIILSVLVILSLGSARAQVRVGVSIGSPYAIGYPFGGVVIAPRPFACQPVMPYYRHRRVYVAPPMVYAPPRYRGLHYGRRW
jgi:hypothetical protein